MILFVWYGHTLIPVADVGVTLVIFLVFSLLADVGASLLLRVGKWGVATANYAQVLITTVLRAVFITVVVNLMFNWVIPNIPLAWPATPNILLAIVGLVEVASWTLIKLQPKEIML